MAKRILLFLLTNIAVVLTISLVLNLLGVQPYLTAQGLDYYNLAAFCLVWGFGGALISLMLSKPIAKFSMGVKVIDPARPGEFGWLVNMVEQLSKAAGLPRTPEIGIWQSDQLNAFATGATKSRALVAFSTGIIQGMSREELEGVTGHELAHIANGDMVTMTLLQGVINAFVMFLARVLSFVISSRGSDRDSVGPNYLLTFVLEIALSFFGMMIVAWFSRRREFRADAGGASYAGREKMIAGLQKLQRAYVQIQQGEEEAASVATLKISGKSTGLMSLFATHPPLEQRIEALRLSGSNSANRAMNA